MSGVVALFPAFALPSSDTLSDLSFALAVTSLPSFTLSAGTVITPVSGSTFTSDPSGTDHFPVSGSFVAVTVTGSVAPSGV